MNARTPSTHTLTSRTKRCLCQHVALQIAMIAFAGTCVPIFAQTSPTQEPPAQSDQPTPTTPPADPAPQTADQQAQQPQLTFAASREPDFSAAQRLRLARILTRTVLMDLRMNAEPSKDDYTLAAIMLKDISSITPDDTQVIRRWIDTAHAAGDEDMVLEATRALVKADPSDTVALLRVLTQRFSQIQIAKDRLAAYEQFLDRAGTIDASVRSRIALDAAMLARDMGDETKFVSLLTKSTQLDSTNKNAAFLAFVYYSQRTPDDMGRLELLNNLLLADPLDPSVHIQIRDLLASNASWAAATRFHNIAKRILDARQASDITDEVETSCLTMNSEGPAKSLADITQELTLARDRQRAVFDQRKKADEALNAIAPEDVRLMLPIEECRAVAAHAADNRDTLSASMSDMAKTAGRSIEVLQDQTRRSAELQEAEATEQVVETIYRLTMWRFLFNLETEFAKTVAVQVSDKMAQDDPRRERFNPWIALRSGDAHAALSQSQNLINAQLDDEWTTICHALALESLGNTSDAADLFRAFASATPLTPLGSWSYWKAQSLKPQPQTDLAKSMARYCTTSIPQWMDLMITNVDGFERLSARQPFTSSVLPIPELTISIRNTSPIPLGIGADRTINSRLLVGPRLDGAHALPPELIKAEVLEANQRLRLLPGEDFLVSFAPDETILGWAIDSVCHQTSRLRYRTLQGFEIDKDGIRYAPKGCLDIDANTLSISPLEDAQIEVQSLIQRVLSEAEPRVPSLLLGSRLQLAAILQNPNNNAMNQDVQNLLRAWAARYASSAPLVRALILCELPGPSDFQMKTILDEVASKDPDPFSLRWFLFTHVADPENPILASAIASTDPLLSMVASLQQARLNTPQKTYSRFGVKGLLAKDQPPENAEPPAPVPAPAK